MAFDENIYDIPPSHIILKHCQPALFSCIGTKQDNSKNQCFKVNGVIPSGVDQNSLVCDAHTV